VPGDLGQQHEGGLPIFFHCQKAITFGYDHKMPNNLFDI